MTKRTATASFLAQDLLKRPLSSKERRLREERRMKGNRLKTEASTFGT